MEFSELNDEIGADDWLIKGEEISERRLIRRTPRYNVYKADWYGDVLVYEPVNEFDKKEKKRETPQLNVENQKQVFHLNQQELSSKLGKLSLNLENNWSLKKESLACSSPRNISSDSESGDSNDSAYSSISSTPQHHTKNFRSEFEFPKTNKLSNSSSLSSMSSSISDISSMSYNNENNANLTSFGGSNVKGKIKYSSGGYSSKQQAKESASPVVLNRDSYRLMSSSNVEQDSSVKGENCNISTNCRSTWFELNELRLIAHESFMLFMGASLDYKMNTEDSTSLVMQMNHPKAQSLYNLLHASKFVVSTGTSSPATERFFTFNKQHRQQSQFSLEAKLNICQQVTNAMTYLHDKNIVHGRLTSVNIYIQLNHRVKISLLDDDQYSIASTSKDSSQTLAPTTFNLQSLTYLSPELIRTIRTGDNCDMDESRKNLILDSNRLTKMSDIFSFGTLLFELFEERFPFSNECGKPNRKNSGNTQLGQSTPTSGSPLFCTPQKSSSPNKCTGNINAPASELIYQIGSGRIGESNLNRVDSKCPAVIEQIIAACWSSEAGDRPVFKQLAFA